MVFILLYEYFEDPDPSCFAPLYNKAQLDVIILCAEPIQSCSKQPIFS
jgi:hypothetical protein